MKAGRRAGREKGGRWVFEVGHETGGGGGVKGTRAAGCWVRARALARGCVSGGERTSDLQGHTRRRRLESPGGRWQGRGACGRE